MKVQPINVSPARDLSKSNGTGQQLGNKTLFTNVLKNESGQVRYFSGTDAEIYFEETFIDEIVQISFQMQQNTMPLFGYNSYVFDDVAVGSRLVNGQFSINFTSGGYLYEVLKALKGISRITQQKKENSFNDPAFQIEHSPLWDKEFNIVISYGDKKGDNVPLGTMLVLHSVRLTGCSQQLDVSGEPVYETYSFIAQDIRTKVMADPVEVKAVEKEEEPIVKFHGISYVTSYEDENNYIPEEIRHYVVNYQTKVATLQFEYTAYAEIVSMEFKPIFSFSNQYSSSDYRVLDNSSKDGVIKYQADYSLRKDIERTYNMVFEGLKTVAVEIKVEYRNADGKRKIQNFRETVIIKNIEP